MERRSAVRRNRFRENARMNILYLVHQFYPMHYTGTEKFLLNLSTAMQKWGHKVKVVTYSFYDDSMYESSEDGFLSRELVYKGIHVVAIKQQRPPNYSEYGIQNPDLNAYAGKPLSRQRPDILHVAHPMRVSEFARTAHRLAIPYLVTMTDFFLMCPKCILVTSKRTLCSGPLKGEACKNDCPEFPTETIKRRLHLAEGILRNASSVVAPSRFLGSLFKNEFNFLEPAVIPYGIDFTHIKRNKRSYAGSGKFIILY